MSLCCTTCIEFFCILNSLFRVTTVQCRSLSCRSYCCVTWIPICSFMQRPFCQVLHLLMFDPVKLRNGQHPSKHILLIKNSRLPTRLQPRLISQLARSYQATTAVFQAPQISFVKSAESCFRKHFSVQTARRWLALGLDWALGSNQSLTTLCEAQL